VKLARHRRFIADRQWVFVASGDDLRRAGFPLLDTLEDLLMLPSTDASARLQVTGAMTFRWMDLPLSRE